MEQRALSIQPKRPVLEFRQLPGANETKIPKISKMSEPLRGKPKFSKMFSRKFSLHSTMLPENLEFSVEWFAFRKIIQQFPEFLETFPENFCTICHRFQIFESFWLNGKRP